jgi:hypothetical protein
MRYAVIMAGGAGTRLWPMSRTGRPKQLLPFIGGKSLLSLAAGRLGELIAPMCLYNCTGEAYTQAVWLPPFLGCTHMRPRRPPTANGSWQTPPHRVSYQIGR